MARQVKREKLILWWGRVFKIPQNIYRIDTETGHGWQVRIYRRKKTKFFSDYGDPEAALKRAEAWLRREEKL